MRIVPLNGAESIRHELVGGKGANLGRLVLAGYPVPPGFCVTTEVYRTVLDDPGLRAQIGARLDGLDYGDLDDLETRTATVRDLVHAAAIPDGIAAAVTCAYAELGDRPYVAVRSSGTAEDLAGASFAGLHDTYLDVRGADELLDAVRNCWASLWTARAVMYRQRNGFDHFEAELAVVVQVMVDADASGVMFTANPRTAATDEVVINSSWGLGEAIVQGIVTPDEFTVKIPGTRILERTLGTKKQQVIRHPETGLGVVVADVDLARQEAPSLPDAEIEDLARWGARVTDHYDGIPQDIEWAIKDSQIYLLQSRPVTGVEFSWDADVDAWQPVPDDPFAIRTRAVADEGWNGAITPLMYSWRAPNWNIVFWDGLSWMNRTDLKQHRIWQYHKGYVYWNCEFEKGMIEETIPAFRFVQLPKIPEQWHADVLAAPFSALDYLKQFTRIKLLRPHLGPFGWFRNMENYFANRVVEADGPSNEQFGVMSDRELLAAIQRQVDAELEFSIDVSVPGLYMYSRDAMASLVLMLGHWYRGTNPNVFSDLLTGTPEPTATIREHVALWRIAKRIRESERLTTDFENHRGKWFFAALRDSDEGRRLADDIEAFFARSGHRGHSDRDICFPRYADQPSLLYAALEVHLKSDMNPEEAERENGRRRTAAYDDVVANFAAQPLGFLKVEAFKLAHDYVMKFVAIRDNEREFLDRYTYCVRRGYLELNRRLMARGAFDTDRDFWFLTRDELEDVLFERANTTLIKAKIAGRMRNWDRLHRKEVAMPKYLQRNHEIELDASTEAADEDGNPVLRGMPTSSGVVTARARVVRELRLTNTVNAGEILVANSTDPGWTPVFSIISGVIVETGGLLSHAGCLAREYGFPAAQVDNALQLIPDGATIQLNGDTGKVTILSDEALADTVGSR